MQRVSDSQVAAPSARPATGWAQGEAGHPSDPRWSGPVRINLGELLSCARARYPGEEPPLRFLPELDRLVEAVNAEADLTWEGAAAVRERLLSALTQQTRLAALMREAPNVAAADIADPVFISGLPGSGASLLQNLLVEHPSVDAPTLWEMLYPTAEGSPGRLMLIGRARAQVEESRRHLRHRTVGRLREATRPGGCHQLLFNAFQSPATGMNLRIPRYVAELENADLTAAYAFHREQLQAITSRIPVASLVLRAPFHAVRVEELLRVYPDARIIRVHRDPATVVTITAGLSAGLRRATSLRVVPREVGREWADHLERHLARASAADRRLGPDRLLDVRHADLVSAPAATVGRVLRFLGVEPSPAVLGNVEGLVRSTAAPASPPHRFQADDFGLSAGELRERFADYVGAYAL
ncbi:sulfotransferase [Streptomyces sp. NPDC003077]|uniref:sulfotransferase family protein n=1 Tax=Streptomyces sp. NPDC003077 TaxID=3154443 RepID=UPI0033A6DB7F